MADLSDIQSAGITKLTGSDGAGVEQTPVQSTSSGALHTNLRDPLGLGITSREDGAGQVGLSSELSSTNFVYSSLNSTVDQLAANATFVGGIELAIYQQNLSLLLVSDQNGIFTVNQYIDAAGLLLANQRIFNITAGVGFSQTLVFNGNYFNIEFKNTGTLTTTTLNINTYSGTIPPSPNYEIDPKNDYYLNVQRGKIFGQSNVSISGYNPTTGNSKEMVWSQSGVYTWKTVAAICTLASSSIDDTDVVGIGARTVLVQGLDANYLPISEIVIMAGTSPVLTTNSYLRVNSLSVISAGSSMTNVGNISMTHTATIINYINAGDGLSQSCFYTVPYGHSVFVLSGYIRCSKIDMSADLYVQVAGIRYKIIKFDIASSEFILNVRAPYEILQTADIWIETAASSGSISASGFLEMIQIKDGY